MAAQDAELVIRRLNRSHDRIVTWDPADLREYGRLERRHLIIKSLLDNKLHDTPNDKPCLLLDCSSGSGCWALEACEMYEDAVVFALDQSELQCLGPLAKRLHCFKGSLEQPLPFEDNTFDLVHCQAVQSQVYDWTNFVAELFRVTAPGGWIYLIEPDTRGVLCQDDSLTGDSALRRWCQICDKAALYMGYDTSIHMKLAKLLEDAGYQQIEERILKAKSYLEKDSSTQEKALAKLTRRDMLEGVRDFGKEALELLQGPQHVLDPKEFISQVQKELKNTEIRWYLEYRGVCGRKPVLEPGAVL